MGQGREAPSDSDKDDAEIGLAFPPKFLLFPCFSLFLAFSARFFLWNFATLILCLFRRIYHPGAGSNLSLKAYFARYFKFFSRPLQRAPGWYILLILHKINVAKFHRMKTSGGKNIRVFLKIDQAGVFKHFKAHIKYNLKKFTQALGQKYL